ncbi:MAG TPA: transketolase C-terminal domain-containing protein [Candidatus Deferrimicrobiaceae bacterium]|jgi:transketolase
MSDLSQRDAFWNRIYEHASRDREVVIVTADMGAPALDRIRLELPSQFVNVGIAEQNAITLSAGLALSGKKVFAYAIAPFITLRCLEQIRVNSGIMQIPIAVVGVGAGFGYADSGPTHHIIEDLAVMRSMAHVSIDSVTDNVMAAAVADLAVAGPSSRYIRLDREPLPDLHSRETDFSEGVAVLRRSPGAYIVATGCMTHVAMSVSDDLAKQGIPVGVIDLYRFPVNEPLFLEAVRDAGRLVTLEEHFLPGGLGSAVCETLADHGVTVPVKRLGLRHEDGYCYEYGGRESIRRHYGLDTPSILSAVRAFLA